MAGDPKVKACIKTNMQKGMKFPAAVKACTSGDGTKGAAKKFPVKK